MRPVDAISGGPEVIGCRSALESFVSSQLANESFAGGSDSGGTPASPFNKDVLGSHVMPLQERAARNRRGAQHSRRPI